MNCRSFRKRQAELLDACPNPATTADLLEHASECSACGRELREARAIMARITPSQRLHASSKIKERIMNSITINELNATQCASRADAARRPRYFKLVQVGVFATILLLAIVAAGRFTGRQSPACATLAQAAEFVQGVKTMHISARMRTIPVDNFDYIDLNTPLIPVEMWKEFGNTPKVRIEKQGRQIVADGKATTLLIESDAGLFATKFDGLAEGCFPTLAPLLHADKLLQRESEATKKSDSVVSVAKKIGSDGKEKTILTINAEAQGDFSESDYTKNKSIIESDNIRIYTFDAETSRLERLQVFVKTKKEDVMVFETTKIEYDIPLKPSLFQMAVPKNAIWDKEPTKKGANDNSWMQPDDVAREFFEALSKSDWQGVSLFTGSIFDSPKLRKMFGGLKINSIGKPFQSGVYCGWFVPYEIRLECGEVRKHNLAVRNDNPEHQWKWDGGL